MPPLPIQIIPAAVLRQKAEPVEGVDSLVTRIMDDMVDTMYLNHGIGLAANQVGILKRIITVDISDSRDGSEALVMANPTVTWSSPETFTYKEGCLSIPDQYADVTRPKKIKMTYLDRNGVLQKLEAEELLSQCIQHEIDHLNGVLFIDHLSSLKRNMIVRKVEKAQRELHDKIL